MSIATKAGRFLFFPRIRNFKAKAAALNVEHLCILLPHQRESLRTTFNRGLPDGVTFLSPVWIYSSTLHDCRYYLVGVLPAL